MRSSPGVSHRVATPRPQLFPVHRTRAPFGAGRGQQRIFSLRHLSPALSTAIPRVVNTSARLVPSIIHRPTSAPVDDPQPACDRAPDTRPPETQRLSLCKGKAEREPAVTGGLVMHEQAKRSHASPVGIRDIGTGSKRAAIRAAWSACRDLPALGSQLRKLTLQASSSRLPARQVSPGRALVQVHPATLPLGLVTPCSQCPRRRTPLPAPRRPNHRLGANRSVIRGALAARSVVWGQPESQRRPGKTAQVRRGPSLR